MQTAAAIGVHTESDDQPAALVERAAHGDQAAWNQLVRRYSPMLWRVARAYRLSHGDAADAVQVSWLRLAEHLHQIRDPARISSWLTTTVRRECLQLCRRRRPILSLDDVRLPADESEQPEYMVDVAEEQRLLLAAFHRLTPRHRLLLAALMANPPPSYADVARQLGMPIGSIGPTRQRALHRLRAEISAPPLGRQ